MNWYLCYLPSCFDFLEIFFQNQNGAGFPNHQSVRYQCIYPDAKFLKKDTRIFFQYLTAVADYCSSEQHPPLCDWRQRIPNAPAVTCPANSHYSGCMSGCPNTCLEPNAAER